MALTKLSGADEALTLSGVVKKDGRNIQEKDLGILKKPILLMDTKKIIFVGSVKEFNSFYKENKKNLKQIKDKKVSGTLMPGYVESHTHLVFSGDRKHEFELRNKGVSYQSIAEQGGGIQYTMKQTKLASSKELLALATARLNEFKKQGVVLLEAKSGYGSDLKTELKILEVISLLKGIKVIPTFLGLHSYPKGTKKEVYVDMVLNKYLKQIHQKTKVRHADIFVDQGYFDNEDLQKMVKRLQELNWSFSAHTDQLNGTGSGVLASELGALSISHCVNMKEHEIDKVARTKTVFNLLPAADFYLKINYPNARYMLESGGKVSLATDFNPGSSPTQNLNFVGVLARLEMKMTLPEVISAYTYNAASALGKAKNFGALLPGYSSQIQILSKSWQDLFYQV